LGVHYKRGRRFFCFASFSKVVGLKMSDQGDFWGDPKGKSELISRDEKRRLKGIVFQGPRDLIMMELNQVRNARL
jgi:hypothetical protein